jgi:predicted Zn finger-like uncharacterized protein
MIIKCPKESCQTAFNVDDSRIPPNGANVRCAVCHQVFRIEPPSQIPEEPPPAVDDYRPETFSTVDEYPPPTTDKSPPPKQHKDEPLRRKEPAAVSQKKTGIFARLIGAGKGYIPFKTKLIYFAATLIFLIGAIVIPIEIYRPTDKLYQLIGTTKNLIGGVQASFNPDELERMNQFAVGTLTGAGNVSINNDENRDYFYLSFNMLLIEGEILPLEKLPKNDAGAVEIEGFEEGFDYKLLDESQYYWKMRFMENPGIFEIFQKYKKILMTAQENAAAAGFDILSAIYVMIDSGKKEGFFKNDIAFLLDGYHWSEAPSYAGEPYGGITAENSYWRKLALDGKEGFDTSPTKPDWKNWGLPRFAADEWGSWFTVWLTQKTGDYYNVFNADFEASSIKELMITVAKIVLGIVLLLGVVVFTIATLLSRLVTRPITELTKGAGEVSEGNYDYEVPLIKKDEFGELTIQFNTMIRGQKERLNLEVTLKKFLGEALLGRAKEGLGFEGRREDCTIMFTDFGGFSTITQKMTASESIIALNTYFGQLVPVLQKYAGFADKYIGDAIVAIFGAPIRLEDHAERAVCAAVAMQQRMREINDKRRTQVCFMITERSLEQLKSEGVPEDVIEKLKRISREGLDYLKKEGISDAALERLRQIKRAEFIAKEELLKGELLDGVLKTITGDDRKVERYRELILNLAQKQERGVFEMRIGLNSGEVIVGALGCDEKLEYTSIGETTNLANRMEAACNIGHVAIAQGTYDRVHDIFFPGINISATPEVVSVKGMGDVPVYRIYVHNLNISKDMKMKDNIKKFYVYEQADHQLKQRPEDVPGVTFKSVAEFV